MCPSPSAEDPQTIWTRYFTPTEEQHALGLFCLGFGAATRVSEPSPERALGCWALVVVRSGTGGLIVGPDRTWHEFTAPCALWLFPGVLHSYRPDGPEWQESWVLFDGTATPTVEKIIGVSRAAPVTPIANLSVVTSAFDRLVTASRRPSGTADLPMLAALYDLLAVSRQPGRPSDAELVAQLQTIALQPAPLARYAADLGLDQAELRSLARRATGRTPIQLVLEARINEAKLLLAGTRLSVAEVGRRVGYDDPGYFSRIFDRMVGQPPSQFRKVLGLH
jgi:AraC-like DNA-binding protein